MWTFTARLRRTEEIVADFRSILAYWNFVSWSSLRSVSASNGCESPHSSGFLSSRFIDRFRCGLSWLIVC